jgi:hypothetical protein
MKAKKPKYKDRYVLGEGYVWVSSGGNSGLQLWDKTIHGSLVPLKIPPEVELEEAPKYRLVLERVKK